MRLRPLETLSRPGLHLFVALALVLVAGLSCRSFDDRTGSSGVAEGPKVDVTGVWVGTWSVVSGVPDSGTVTFDIEQDGDDQVVGTSTWEGSPCWTNPIPGDPDVYEPVPAKFEGDIAGSVLPLVTVMDILRDPQGANPRRDSFRLTGRIEIVNELMVGTFSVTQPTVPPSAALTRCDDNVHRLGDRGVFELRRQ